MWAAAAWPVPCSPLAALQPGAGSLPQVLLRGRAVLPPLSALLPLSALAAPLQRLCCRYNTPAWGPGSDRHQTHQLLLHPGLCLLHQLLEHRALPAAGKPSVNDSPPLPCWMPVFLPCHPPALSSPDSAALTGLCAPFLCALFFLPQARCSGECLVPSVPLPGLEPVWLGPSRPAHREAGAGWPWVLLCSQKISQSMFVCPELTEEAGALVPEPQAQRESQAPK